MMNFFEMKQHEEYVSDDMPGIKFAVATYLYQCNTLNGLPMDYHLSNISYNVLSTMEFVEYKKDVDWTKVKIDTPVFARGTIEEEWTPYHFCKYEKGKVFVWLYGKTSHTIKDCSIQVISHRFAKLLDNEEVK